MMLTTRERAQAIWNKIQRSSGSDPVDILEYELETERTIGGYLATTKEEVDRVETEAFLRGQKSGKHLAELEQKYGSFGG